ncbi:MAG TPA: hypothetical protein VGU27_12145, partial [Candidatus Eisenbacteria bacterium]|nr:hypothetical protein [Candidatus Eisenbacteria bacterium]
EPARAATPPAPPAPAPPPASLRQAPEFETPASQQIPWPPTPEEVEKLEQEPPPAPLRAPAPPVLEMPGAGAREAPDESLTQPALPEPEPEQAAADDEPAAPDEAALDAEAFARAAEDFLTSSPVLGAKGRPVKRQSDGTTYSEPDAVAVGSLAAELAKLDVPAGRRGVARAQLLDLAGRLDEGQLDWAALRDAVHFAMEYPELARRLVPILLPWLDRAA